MKIKFLKFLKLAILMVNLSCNSNSFIGGGDEKSEPKTTSETQEANAAEESESADGGSDNPLAAIDLACQTSPGTKFERGEITPKVSVESSVPSSCKDGVEFNNYKAARFKMASKNSSIKQLKLHIDVATYTAPDRISFKAISKSGKETIVFDTCRLRTAKYSAPPDEMMRPPEDTIREFNTSLPSDTVAIEIDQRETQTPSYLRIIGLCDFELSAKVLDNEPVPKSFRVVSGQ